MSCCMDRRQFVEAAALTATLTAAKLTTATALAASADPPQLPLEPWDPDQPQVISARPLVVQPLLRHEIETPKSKTSWRNWGGVHTEEAVAEEIKRIGDELAKLSASAEFPLTILPLATVRNNAEASALRDRTTADVLLLYAAGATWLDPCISEKRHTIIFVRHRSGPVYDWYENVSNRFLRVPGKEFEYDQYRNFKGVGVDDVVVDDYSEILWRLRAIYGVKNLRGGRVVTVGKAGGKGCPKAPLVAREKYGLEIVEVPYAQLQKRIDARRADSAAIARIERWTASYLGQKSVTLRTGRPLVERTVVLYTIFKDLLREHDAQSFTIAECMTTVMPIADTTACLALTLLQDEGYIAFCEADFVSHPAGVLLRYIAGKPVFMHNPTFPHKGIVTCAHCASPRRFDGRTRENVEILTHYESDFGASPKVTIPVGTQVTLLDPDAAQVRWLGFTGVVDDNPRLSICRSQQDIRIQGDWRRLAREIRGSHWMLAYGNYLAELGYAARKLGLDWLNLSET